MVDDRDIVMERPPPERPIPPLRRGVTAWLRTVVALACAAIGLVSSAQGQAVVTNDKRVALVIGIGKYQFAPHLANPDNDARRIAEALRRLNFEVEESYDADYRTLTRTLRSFGLRAQDADAALIFYAGHGVQVEHENYLLPADAKLEREHDLVYEALALDLFLGEVSQAKKVGILLLDACRNNPFVEKMSRGISVAGRAASMQKGLARVDAVPRNTIVVLATRADEIAEDGGAENSPFTQALLAHFQIPGLELSLFFRSVRDTVLKATKDRQEPFVFSSLGAEPFYFYPRPPNRPPTIGAITQLEVKDAAGPTPLGVPRPTDPDDDPLTVRVVGLPRSGEIRIDGRQVAANDVVSLEKFMTATYKPDGKMRGPVGTFDFIVEDGRGGNVMGSLPIAVAASNHPPEVEPDRLVRILPGALGIKPPTDPDNDPLTVTITSVPTRGSVRNGTLTLKNGDRLHAQDMPALVYVPDPGASGDVGALRYLVDDGRGGKAEGRVEIDVAPVDDATRLVSDASLWQQLRDKGDLADVQAFLRLFPDSPLASEARRRERDLAGSAATVAAAAPPPMPPPAVKPTPTPSPPPPAPAAQPAPPPAPAAQPAPPPAAAAAPPQPPAAQPTPTPSPTPSLADATRRSADTRVAVAAPRVPPPAAPAPASPQGDKPFSECGECPVMVPIPAGSFVMGEERGDPTAAPPHHVSIARFALAERPIRVSEWKACVAAGGCSAVRGAGGDDEASMHNVSWDDAQQYVAWLSKKTGHHYRLPSEAEWEYAARANTHTRYWWGEQVGAGLANCTDCGGEQAKSGPLPVENYKANAFALLGVLGGVSQWVGDCWFQNYQGAPADGSARDRKSCSERVLRGGSYRNDRNNITVSVRNYYDASVRYPGNGFRVAADLQ
jgi:formylglycine-generating enzyme required for sulfatase activity